MKLTVSAVVALCLRVAPALGQVTFEVHHELRVNDADRQVTPGQPVRVSLWGYIDNVQGSPTNGGLAALRGDFTLAAPSPGLPTSAISARAHTLPFNFPGSAGLGNFVAGPPLRLANQDSALGPSVAPRPPLGMDQGGIAEVFSFTFVVPADAQVGNEYTLSWAGSGNLTLEWFDFGGVYLPRTSGPVASAGEITVLTVIPAPGMAGIGVLAALGLAHRRVRLLPKA